MHIREVLALNLRQRRKLQGLSQEELAHRADLDRTYVSALERQVYAATVDVLDKLAVALEMDTAALLMRPILADTGRAGPGNEILPQKD